MECLSPVHNYKTSYIGPTPTINWKRDYVLTRGVIKPFLLNPYFQLKLIILGPFCLFKQYLDFGLTFRIWFSLNAEFSEIEAILSFCFVAKYSSVGNWDLCNVTTNLMAPFWPTENLQQIYSNSQQFEGRTTIKSEKYAYEALFSNICLALSSVKDA